MALLKNKLTIKAMDYNGIVELLGDRAKFLLDHTSETVSKEHLHLPGPDFINRVFRNPIELQRFCVAYRPCFRMAD